MWKMFINDRKQSCKLGKASRKLQRRNDAIHMQYIHKKQKNIRLTQVFNGPSKNNTFFERKQTGINI